MEQLAPEIRIDPVYGPTAERVERVLDGRLDVTFVRGSFDHPDLRRIPVWTDLLLVAISARHPLAGEAEVKLSDLAPFPLRMTERRNNAALVDLVIRACHEAGFAPAPGPISTMLTDTLAVIGTDESWTVVYAAHTRQLRHTRVVFRPLADPGLAITTALLVRRGSPPAVLESLLRACTSDDNDR
jgi:hypothetical protein